MGHIDMIAIVVVVLALVFAGVHIAIALGITAALGIYLMTGDIEVVRNFIANTAYEALRDYVFAVIPLFMLMGDFLAKCGAARDLYTLGNRASKGLPGRLAAATILANALFGFVTGVSIAAAAAFSRIAYPEMRRYGYRRLFILLRREGELSGINRIHRLYREEGPSVRKRRARRKAVGARAPILVEAKPNARWSTDFVHDQLANGAFASSISSTT